MHSGEYILTLAGVFLLVFFIALVVRKPLLEMIERAGMLRPNYEDKNIPLAAGIIFPVSFVAGYIPLCLILPYLQQSRPLFFVLAIVFASFLGLVDDLLGSRETTGLKGHFKMLLQGRLTTGGFKALFGGLLALLVAVATGPLKVVVLNALLIALFTNAVNLLDLRPGRAGKFFVLVALLFIAAGWGQEELLLLVMLLGGALVLLPLDLRARAMMGDTGSNALGAGLGVMCMWLFEPVTKLVILLFLIAFHLFAEKYSLTRIIAGNRLLNFIDHLGRNK